MSFKRVSIVESACIQVVELHELHTPINDRFPFAACTYINNFRLVVIEQGSANVALLSLVGGAGPQVGGACCQ